MQGSIPVILALWCLVYRGHIESKVFTTNIDIKDISASNNHLGELDFTFLEVNPFYTEDYKLVLGEAWGRYDYTQDDINKMRRIADRFDSDFRRYLFLCFATIKDSFSSGEKKLLSGLIADGYKVIALTRLELEPYDLYKRFENLPPIVTGLEALAGNTQHINLQSQV
jgi:hypothetical protein